MKATGRVGRVAAIGASALILSSLMLAPAAIAAEQDDQQACVNDALTVCSQFIPDRERVAGCLMSNRSRISEACRTALRHFNPLVSPAKLTTVR